MPYFVAVIHPGALHDGLDRPSKTAIYTQFNKKSVDSDSASAIRWNQRMNKKSIQRQKQKDKQMNKRFSQALVLIWTSRLSSSLRVAIVLANLDNIGHNWLG